VPCHAGACGRPASRWLVQSAMAAPTAAVLRQRAVAEVIQSERSYLTDMTAFYDVYVKPLAEKWNPSAAPEATDVFVQLERNTATVLTYSRQLLEDCEEENAAGQFAVSVGRVLGDAVVMLKGYQKFVQQQTRVKDELAALTEGNKKFRGILKACTAKKEAADRVRNMDMGFFLIMPIQRVPRYVLLLETIIKHTEAGHPGMEALQSALKRMRETANVLNASISRKESEDAVAGVLRSIAVPAAPSLAGGSSGALGRTPSASVSDPLSDLRTSARSLVGEGDWLLPLGTLAVDFIGPLLKDGGLAPRADALQRFIADATAVGVAAPAVPVHAVLLNDVLLLTIPRGDPLGALQRVNMASGSGAASTRAASAGGLDLFLRVNFGDRNVSVTATGSGEGSAVLTVAVLPPGAPTGDWRVGLRLYLAPSAAAAAPKWVADVARCNEIAAGRVLAADGVVNMGGGDRGRTAARAPGSAAASESPGPSRSHSMVSHDDDPAAATAAAATAAGTRLSSLSPPAIAGMSSSSPPASLSAVLLTGGLVARELVPWADPAQLTSDAAAVERAVTVPAGSVARGAYNVGTHILLRAPLDKQGGGMLGVTGWAQRIVVLRLASMAPEDDDHLTTSAAAVSRLSTSATASGSGSVEDDFDDSGPSGPGGAAGGGTSGGGGGGRDRLMGAGPGGQLPDAERGQALRGSIEYYKDMTQLMSGQAPQGAVGLSQLTGVTWLGANEPKQATGLFGFGGASKEKLRSFEVLTGNRKFTFRAASEKDAQVWCTTLAVVLQLRDRAQRDAIQRRIAAEQQRAHDRERAAEAARRHEEEARRAAEEAAAAEAEALAAAEAAAAAAAAEQEAAEQQGEGDDDDEGGEEGEYEDGGEEYGGSPSPEGAGGGGAAGASTRRSVLSSRSSQGTNRSSHTRVKKWSVGGKGAAGPKSSAEGQVVSGPATKASEILRLMRERENAKPKPVEVYSTGKIPVFGRNPTASLGTAESATDGGDSRRSPRCPAPTPASPPRSTGAPP